MLAGLRTQLNVSAVHEMKLDLLYVRWHVVNGLWMQTCRPELATEPSSDNSGTSQAQQHTVSTCICVREVACPTPGLGRHLELETVLSFDALGLMVLGTFFQEPKCQF